MSMVSSALADASTTIFAYSIAGYSIVEYRCDHHSLCLLRIRLGLQVRADVRLVLLAAGLRRLRLCTPQS